MSALCSFCGKDAPSLLEAEHAAICESCVNRARQKLKDHGSEKDLADLRATWKSAVDKISAKTGVRKDVEAPSRRTKWALYDPADMYDLEFARDVGYPGTPPFTRGIHPTMYRSRLWTMRQYAGFTSPEESNRRYRYLLSQGQMGLSVAFDLPTQIGMDSDEDLARGEVGKVGVPISTLDDMATLFDGIPLEKVSVSMTINASAIILLALFVAVGKRQGLKAGQLSGTVQNDILKEYIARGTYIYPPRQSLRLVTDIFDYCLREMPKFNPISISGYHIREAGSTAAQELAFTFANGIAYMEAAKARGLDLDRLGRQISFFFNGHSDFLEEVAKYRAARRMWCRILNQRFGVRDAEALRMRFHTQTAGSTLTAQEPMNNVTRVALQALAAVLGGTQSLHTNALDEALGLPTEETARIALRTQQIIAHESGVADVADPLGGSWAIERLTGDLESEARDLIEAVDKVGGVLPAIEAGFIQQKVQEAAYQFQRDVEDGKRLIVGVNIHKPDDRSKVQSTVHDPETERSRVARLGQWKAARDGARASAAVNAVEVAAAGSDNLMPVIVEALERGASLGELAHALRRVFGEYQDPAGL